VYGYSSHNKIDFVQWIINMCELNNSFGVVNDQLSNPTLTDDIALGIKKIIEKKRTGLYHFGGLDFINRIDFAKKIAEIYHLDDSLIQPITTESLNQKAKRPLQSGLISLKASTDLGVKFCGIESGLITLRHQMHVFSQYSK
jgi:dTDP-4-dehydrorhamnose reductase